MRRVGDVRATTVELFQDRYGDWRFRAKAGNGEIIAASEGYSRKDSAKRGARRAFPAARIVSLS
jgi:uncharacterized protein YegP (UPF0339 family)